MLGDLRENLAEGAELHGLVGWDYLFGGEGLSVRSMMWLPTWVIRM
jgi:hypothetical protein